MSETNALYNTIVTDDDISKEAAMQRGARLKRLRNLANLSRKDMCSGSGVNINTLKGWEVGRHGGLTVKGAEKALQHIRKEGVVCTLDWLLYEIGSGPTLLNDFDKVIQVENTPTEYELHFTDEDKNIAQELTLFRKHYKLAVDFIVNDDSMLPFYRIGDYIAGIKRNAAHIDSLLGQNCIVQRDNGQMLFRQLRAGNQAGTYNLFCLNTETSLPEPVLYNVTLVNAAAVIWQRRKHISA